MKLTEKQIERSSSAVAEPRRFEIRVNAISPGPTETEGTHAIYVFESEMGKQLVAGTPLGRAGQPEDIAPAAVFMASDAGACITGETIRVSGGAY